MRTLRHLTNYSSDITEIIRGPEDSSIDQFFFQEGISKYARLRGVHVKEGVVYVFAFAVICLDNSNNNCAGYAANVADPSFKRQQP